MNLSSPHNRPSTRYLFIHEMVVHQRYSHIIHRGKVESDPGGCWHLKFRICTSSPASVVVQKDINCEQSASGYPCPGHNKRVGNVGLRARCWRKHRLGIVGAGKWKRKLEGESPKYLYWIRSVSLKFLFIFFHFYILVKMLPTKLLDLIPLSNAQEGNGNS